MNTPSEQRQLMIAWRAALDEATQKAHAQALCQHLDALPALRTAHHIGTYHAVRGELDPRLWMNTVWASRPDVVFYLPRMQGPSLTFVPYHPNTPTQPNPYGILEAEGTGFPASSLEVVLMPVVAFDPTTGARLGMGSGCYDRTLGHDLKHPYRVGLAHQHQATTLHPEPWDVPCHAVATERQVFFL